MVDYSIAAIPTEYRGRTYRSRLEARWAAFFDRLGLAHEYEPFDLGAWSPDFLLTDLECLVEVKPLTDLDLTVWKKLIAACRARRLFDNSNIGGVLLSMVAPLRSTRDLVQIGWAGVIGHDDMSRPFPAYVCWSPHPKRPQFDAWITTVRGPLDHPAVDEIEWPYGDYTMAQWARATSDVQWLPES
jgi:hypothetical protein